MKNTSTQRSHGWAAQNTLQKCVPWVGTSLCPLPSVKALPELTRSLQIPWVFPHSHWPLGGSRVSRDGSFLCRCLFSQAESWLLSAASTCFPKYSCVPPEPLVRTSSRRGARLPKVPVRHRHRDITGSPWLALILPSLKPSPVCCLWWTHLSHLQNGCSRLCPY